MGTILPAIFLVFVVLVILGGTLLVRRTRRRRGLMLDPSPTSARLVGFRKTAGWRWAGLVVGVVAAAQTASVGSLGLGVGQMLAPTAFGLCVIGGVVAGELATMPARDGVRTAALETRTVGNYLPRRLGGLVAVSTLALGTLLVVTTLMGSPDDLGRAGRSLEQRCGAVQAGGTGPWPGSFYSVPLAIAVALGLLAAGLALRTVVMRPRRGSTPELVRADDALRRRSAQAVVAATGVMMAASLIGVALAAASALLNPYSCAPAWWTVLGFSLLTVAVLMFLLVGGCLAQLLMGAGTRPRESGDGVRTSEEVRL
jgi:hypothetical protein